MKKLILIACFVWSANEIFAQQLPIFSQYMLNSYFQNPASAGSTPYFDAVSAYRLQWIGITDAPRTFSLSMNGPLQYQKMGVGGYLFTDIAGPTRRIGCSGSYAYHITLKEKLKLSFSLSGGVVQFSIDASKLTLDDPSDYVFINGYQQRILPDFGTSFYLYSLPKENGTGNWWFGGYVPQIFPARIKFATTPATKGTLATHFYFNGGYNLFLTDEFTLEPSFLFNYVYPVSPQVNLGARAIYRSKAWVGVTYRTADAISCMAGYNYRDNILFGYSYDVTTSRLKKYSNGTHELIISFRFKAPEQPAPAKVTVQ